jgi:hypothetical protein
MKLSMSRASLALHCPWPFAEGRIPPSGNKTYAAFRLLGHTFHGCVAKYINDGELDPVGVITSLGIPGDLQENVAKILSMHPWSHAEEIIKAHPLARAEIAYAYDPVTNTARKLGEDIGRAYEEHGLLPHEVPGTADVVWLEPDEDTQRRDDIVVVHDWKVVFGSGAHVPPPELNYQLHTLALCAMLVSGTKRARVQVCILDEHGNSYVRAHNLTRFEAMVAMKRVLKAAASGVSAEPNPGKHCIDHYCPMLALCPAVQSLVDETYQLAPDAPMTKMPIVVDPKKITSDAHAAYLVTVAGQVAAVANTIREACKEYVRRKGEPIEMSPTTTWGPHRQTKTAVVSTSVQSLATVIAPFVGGMEVARNIVVAGVTKKALDREIASHSAKGAMKANLAACMDALAQFGMIRTMSDGEKFEEKHKKIEAKE